MIKALIVALTSELSFALALAFGSIVSVFAVLAVTAVRGYGRLTATRAVLQGVISGLFAGASGLWVAVKVGRSLSTPDSWLLWLAVAPPILGEFGDFLRRFSLQYRGTPDTGVFAPLGRLHGAAKAGLQRAAFQLALEVFRESDSEQKRVLAARKSIWFIGWVSSGVFSGAFISMWWVAHLSNIMPQ